MIFSQLDQFGSDLQKARAKMDKTVAAVAKEIGVAKKAPSSWENGLNFPTEDKLPNIARAYGMDLETLTQSFAISREARESLKGGGIRAKSVR